MTQERPTAPKAKAKPRKRVKLKMLEPRLKELPPRLATLPPKKPKWD